MEMKQVVLFSHQTPEEMMDRYVDKHNIEIVKHITQLTDLEKELSQCSRIMLILGRDLELEEREHGLLLGLKYKVQVGIIPGLYESLLIGASTVPISDKIPVVLYSPNEKKRLRLKGFLQRSIAAIGLFALAPLFFFLAILIKIDSKGPVFYSQKRVGLYGKTFTLWKFRSMFWGAEDHTGPVFSSEDDNRVTRVGNFLRKTHLDELPQLFNIARGDMSFVGPRPERPEFVREFQRNVANYHLRHLVAPGITGKAQISAGYNAEAKVKLIYDLQHLGNQSLLSDIKVMFATIPHFRSQRKRK